MKIIPRASWTNRKVNLSLINEPVPESYVHHLAMTVDKNLSRAGEEAVMRGTEAFHINGRGMSAIAYSYVIFQSGRVYEGRGVKLGGHTFGHNSVSLGLCAAGNFEVQTPTPKMVDAYGDLISHLKHRGALTWEKHPTGGHRDVGAAGGGTACPGNNLYKKIPEMVREHEQHRHRHAGPHDKGAHHHHPHHPHPHLKRKDHHHRFS